MKCAFIHITLKTEREYAIIIKKRSPELVILLSTADTDWKTPANKRVASRFLRSGL